MQCSSLYILTNDRTIEPALSSGMVGYEEHLEEAASESCATDTTYFTEQYVTYLKNKYNSWLVETR